MTTVGSNYSISGDVLLNALVNLVVGMCVCLIRVIIDSGATSHMLPCREFFTSLAPVTSGTVSLGDNNVKIPVRGRGPTIIPYVQDAIYVICPEFNSWTFVCIEANY
jgi:hypothetical protein